MDIPPRETVGTVRVWRTHSILGLPCNGPTRSGNQDAAISVALRCGYSIPIFLWPSNPACEWDEMSPPMLISPLLEPAILNVQTDLDSG